MLASSHGPFSPKSADLVALLAGLESRFVESYLLIQLFLVGLSPHTNGSGSIMKRGKAL